ncbi:MAG: hypothetical protein ACI4JT_04865 [Oscillospiraceae bacterium]
MDSSCLELLELEVLVLLEELEPEVLELPPLLQPASESTAADATSAAKILFFIGFSS